MGKDIKFHYSVINITIHPHAPKLYTKLLELACSAPHETCKFHGNESMTLILEHPDELDTGKHDVPYLTGLIQRFTTISGGEWFDSQAGTAVSVVDIPQFDCTRYHPNLSTFPFVFLPDGHRMFVTIQFTPDRPLSVPAGVAFFSPML